MVEKTCNVIGKACREDWNEYEEERKERKAIGQLLLLSSDKYNIHIKYIVEEGQEVSCC